MDFCENCGVQEGRGPWGVILVPRKDGKTLCVWCICNVPEANLICRPPTRAEFEAQFLRRDSEEFEAMRQVWNTLASPEASECAEQRTRRNAAKDRLWDAMTEPYPGGDASCRLRALGACHSVLRDQTTSDWLYKVADALESPKPAPPEALMATCTECGKPITRASDEGPCPGPEAWPETAEALHPKCVKAFVFRKRGERVCASLKPGDAVRMASKPRPITASGKALDPEAPQNQAPLFLAGKVGTVLWVCRDKPAVCVSFFSEKDGYGWECHCGNLTRLVPDPAFKE